MATNWAWLRAVLIEEPTSKLETQRSELFRKALALYRLRLRYADAFNAHKDGKAWLSALTRVMGGNVGKVSSQRIDAAYQVLIQENNPQLAAASAEQHLDALCPWPAQKREAGLTA